MTQGVGTGPDGRAGPRRSLASSSSFVVLPTVRFSHSGLKVVAPDRHAGIALIGPREGDGRGRDGGGVQSDEWRLPQYPNCWAAVPVVAVSVRALAGQWSWLAMPRAAVYCDNWWAAPKDFQRSPMFL